MKLIFLPFYLVSFWYVEGLVFFIRSWKNLILLLEEDLAVGLMFRMFFTPLFQDSNSIGRALSLVFRLIRIIIGLFAFILVTIVIILLAFYWFSLPAILYLNYDTKLNLLVVFCGIVLFLIHTFSRPHKKVWQIKKNIDNFWESSRIKKSQLNPKKILRSEQVQLLLQYLECQNGGFTQYEIYDLGKLGKDAFDLARKTGSAYIGYEHFFVAMLQQQDLESELLKLNLELTDFEETLKFLEMRKNKWRRVFIWDEDFIKHHLKGINREWLGAPTPKLDSISEDITRTVARYSAVDFIGRGNIFNQVVTILSQDVVRNVLLIAPVGAGKNTLINYLAKQIISGDVPYELITKRLVRLNYEKLLFGINTQEDAAIRIRSAFEEAQFAEDTIVVLEQVHELCLNGFENGVDLYSLIAPFLEYGNFQFIATTDPEHYKRILEAHNDFGRFFSRVDLPVASKRDIMEILEDRAIDIERKYKLRVSFLALKKCVQVLPDSAIHLLNEAVAKVESGWIYAKSIE